MVNGHPRTSPPNSTVVTLLRQPPGSKRVTRILDAVAERELEIKVRATDAGDIIEGMQKIANRVTSGLILAALIIAAAVGAVVLLVNIYLQDRHASGK